MKFNVFNVVAIAAIAAFGFVIWQKLQPAAPNVAEPRITQNVAIPAPAQTGEIKRAEPTPALPPPKITAPSALDNSDASVRSALEDFAPQLLQWLTPSEQIRKWVLLVDAVADGSIPNDQLPLALRVKPFQGERHGETFVIDKANFERAAPLVAAIVAIPPEHLLQYYRNWSPLLERAYRELGRRDNFDTRLRVALSRIGAARPLPATTELTQAGVYFVYTDNKFEKASDLEKLLWRIGPESTQRLQEYADQFRQML